LAKSVRIVELLARRSTERGARVLDGHTVTGIRLDAGRVAAVQTDRGDVPADVVVCAAGIWGPLVGAMVGQPIPLLPLEHQYARTGPLPQLAAIAAPPEQENGRPILRDQDRDMYYREHVDRIGLGGYGHEPIPLDPSALLHPRESASPAMRPFTPDHFTDTWASALELMPALTDSAPEDAFNGVFSFTPDGFPLLGESRDVPGFWVAEAVWITHSAGVTRAMAEWLVEGSPRVDIHEMDLARFEPHQTTRAYVEARGRQNYIEVYDIIHPLQPMEQPRPLRTSPFYPRQVELGARFHEGSGWERPHWYEANATLPGVADVPSRGEWASRFWSPIAGAEARATREGVGLYDLTPLTRIAVTGPGAAAFLQRMTTNDIDRSPGTVVYTLMLDERGGIRSDLTVARLATDRFQIGANGRLDVDWLLRHAPTDGSVRVEEVTAGTCCLGLWGPRARDLLSRVTSTDLSNDAFRYFRARQLVVGHVPVTALRVSYVGELGWELYTTADMGLALWDTVWRAGEDLGVAAAGRSAFASLRLEKGYRLWGVDMTTDNDPWEAGLGWVVKPAKGDFIGRGALEDRGEDTVRRRLVPLVLDDSGQVLMGREPVWLEGRPAGCVTSAAFGYTIGRSIAYAWLPADAAPGTRVEVETFGECVGATVEREPLFDPEGARLRA
jgi:glycine cleavage system aminomethyltransferase T